MAKFRKKPVVIEAVRWTGIQIDLADGGNFPRWLSDAQSTVMTQAGAVQRVGDALHIVTLEGVMIASPGDWIVRGVKNELYPVKPDIFEATYEPVSET